MSVSLTEWYRQRHLTDADKEMQKLVAVIGGENWTMLHTMRQQNDWEPAVFYDKVAEAACYLWASMGEPTRSKEWTNLRGTLELLQYPAWGEASWYRHTKEMAPK